ncbi:hypothetical protein SJ2017_2576 [Shewanella japonica]|uniref:Uncharacterized protein n=1 Tax=Shewanella japonica TaxID=93973 RepID=A0ABM6JNK7_9GAMM|nr:hypothetical protein SJ2017_2576 [Shewanella japonica]
MAPFLLCNVDEDLFYLNQIVSNVSLRGSKQSHCCIILSGCFNFSFITTLLLFA